MSDVDELMARMVMGWQLKPGNGPEGWAEWKDRKGNTQTAGVGGGFHPTTDDAAAFKVVDQFRKWQFRLEYGVFLDTSWSATFTCGKPVLVATASAPTRQLAICRAAYKAKQLQIGEDCK
jgi:Phage ABA sandwich domain